MRLQGIRCRGTAADTSGDGCQRMTSESAATVHYEVYAFKNARWCLHARFGRNEKQLAVEEAKTVERTLGIAAKVVRENYFPGNNVSEEIGVYAGDPALRAAGERMAPRTGAGRAMGRPDSNLPPSPTGAKGDGRALPVGAATSMGLLVKLTLISLASMTVAGAATGICNMFLQKMASDHFNISEEATSLLLFCVFVLTFLASGLPMAMAALNWQNSSAGARPKAAVPAPVRRNHPSPAGEQWPEADLTEDLDQNTDDIDWSAGGEDDDDEPLPPVEDAAEPDPASGEAEDTPREEAPEMEKAEAADEAAIDPLEPQKMSMIRFLSGILAEVKKIRPNLDSYNIFGIDLMLAGAVDAMGDSQGLAMQNKRDILKKAIEVLGTKPATAQTFIEKLEDYLVEPKYMAMVQAGRSAMESFFSGGITDPEMLTKVFQQWNKPKQTTQAGPRIQTVLFTDMVGSTDMTQARGDQAAQHIVRRHNSIVRGALAEFSGKEIKHTGDGIMAAFASAANGVEACIAIQKAVAKHNESNPEQELHLRIGINAGEPIEEEDDLFGSTVQLAARVCAKTGTDEIYCTNVVRELSAGNRDLMFVEKGMFEMKGFKDPIALFQVMWS